MPKVTCDISKITVDPKMFKHLKDIEFSEKLPMNSNTSTKVEVLIGEPYTTNLFKELIVGDSNSIDLPAAAVYKIGTCLSGSANPKDKQSQTNVYSTIEVCEEEEDPIENIKSWFTLENVGIEDPSTASQLTVEEQRAVELMENNTYYDKENKFYQTRLLWKNEPIQYTNVKRATATATRVIKRFSKENQQESLEYKHHSQELQIR